ncbi:hypothetical protein [Candidatus Palauibacter sp.]|uniref:hypothetical protein n=1 Tax=Candidatus Palauibacter sp. TaxID=3101350 RepID=UPI003B01F18F
MSNRIWSRALVSAALLAGCGDSTPPGPEPEGSDDGLTVAESRTLMALLAGLGVDDSDSLPEPPEVPLTIACPGGGTALVDGMISTEESEGRADLEVDVEIELRDCVLMGDGVTFVLAAAELEQAGTGWWTVDGLEFTTEVFLRMAGEFSFDVGDRRGSCSADFEHLRRIGTEHDYQHVIRKGRICGHDVDMEVLGPIP